MLNTNINKQYIPKKKKKTLNKCIYIKCNKINYKQKMNY